MNITTTGADVRILSDGNRSDSTSVKFYWLAVGELA